MDKLLYSAASIAIFNDNHLLASIKLQKSNKTGFILLIKIETFLITIMYLFYHYCALSYNLEHKGTRYFASK